MRLDRLKKRRNDLKLTQQYCADLLSVDKSTYFRYEKGELPIPDPALEVLARRMEVSADWLLGLVDERRSYLVEEGLSAIEQRLVNAARNGDFAGVNKAAVELNEQKNKANITSGQPAPDS